MLKITKILSILLFFCLIIPIKASSDFSQPSFTGYYTLEPDPPYEEFFYNRAGQTLNLPSQPVAGLSAINVRMSGIDLGLEPGCKAIPYLAVYIVNNYVNQWYLFLPLGTQSTPGGYTPLAADYYFGGSDYSSDPNNLIGHDVLVPFVAREDQNFRNQNELDANGKVIASSTVANLNDIKVFHLYGAHPIYDIWGNTACSQMFHSTWYRHAPFKVLVGHGTDVLTGSQQRSYYSETLGNTVLSDEDLTFTLITSTSTPPTPTKTPVLIVPGTLATDIYKGNDLLWLNIIKMVETNDDRFMDPLGFNQDGTPIDSSLTLGQVLDKPDTSFDYSQALVNDFSEQGYFRNQQLFLFSYDWRNYIEENANGPLRQKIDELASSSPIGKIDIIAHSQGGLLIKRLLFDHPEYKDKIQKLIFVGTPNLGAPLSFKVLREGDQLGIKYLKVLGLDPEEIKRISQNMPSIYEMLPSVQYFNHYPGYWGELERHLFSSNREILYNYSDTKQRLKDEGFNSMLLDKNDTFHAFNYDQFDFTNMGIDVYNIAGCQSPTYGGVINKSLGRDKIIWVPGDQTVPLKSASNIINTQLIYSLDANHSTMLTDEGIRHKIINLITGSNLSTPNLTDNITDCHFDGTIVESHSPVNLHIYDSQGRHVGPRADGGFDSEISNVGYDTLGHENFAFLPKDGQYSVKLVATSAGSFSFNSTIIRDGQALSMAYYDQVSISSSSVAQIGLDLNNNQPIQLDTNGDGTIDQTVQPSAILDASQSQDLIPPVSTSTITGIIGQPGFYRSDVSISLSAQDPVIPGHESETSGVLKTQYNLDNAGWIDYASTTPIAVSTEGSHTLVFFSTDRAGNNESEQSISFTIDKTPPEFAVQYDLTAKDFKYSAQDNLDSNPTIACTSSNCILTDQAGNQTVAKFVKTSLLFSQNLTIKSLSYNGVNASLPINGVLVSVVSQNNRLKSFNQMFYLAKNSQIFSITYSSLTNQSTIIDALTGLPPTITTQLGIKFLQVYTDKGILKTNIK